MPPRRSEPSRSSPSPPSTGRRPVLQWPDTTGSVLRQGQGRAPDRRVAGPLRWVRRTIIVVVALFVAGPAGTADAHVGWVATSDYLTVVNGIAPAIPGLDVTVVDLSGTLQLHWTGSGPVIVAGYAGEPYLRLANGRVERNRRSPATTLNRDRFANVDADPQADAKAEPVWEAVSTGTTVIWHDHRTHWMSNAPPPDVQAHPSRPAMVIPEWQIPLDVDGQAVTVSGYVAWVPPPSKAPWLCTGGGWLVVVAAAMVVGVWRQRLLVVAAALLAVVFLSDSVGWLIASGAPPTERVHDAIWIAVVALAGLALGLLRARPVDRLLPVGAIALVGAVVGGIGRLAALSHARVASALPDWWCRLSTTTCVTLGLVLGAGVVFRLVITIAAPPKRPGATVSSGARRGAADDPCGSRLLGPDDLAGRLVDDGSRKSTPVREPSRAHRRP